MAALSQLQLHPTGRVERLDARPRGAPELLGESVRPSRRAIKKKRGIYSELNRAGVGGFAGAEIHVTPVVRVPI